MSRTGVPNRLCPYFLQKGNGSAQGLEKRRKTQPGMERGPGAGLFLRCRAPVPELTFRRTGLGTARLGKNQAPGFHPASWLRELYSEARLEHNVRCCVDVVPMLYRVCSDYVPMVFQCCSNVVPMWPDGVPMLCPSCRIVFRMWSAVAPRVFRCCSKCVLLLLQCCPDAVPTVFRFSSEVVPSYFRCGSDGVPVLFRCWSDFVSM